VTNIINVPDQLLVTDFTANSTLKFDLAAEIVKSVDNSLHSVTVNLFKLHLSQTDIDLLDKGLSFIPTLNSVQLFRFYEAQNRLIRNLKIKDYFSTRPSKDYDYRNKKFTPASNWCPPDH